MNFLKTALIHGVAGAAIFVAIGCLASAVAGQGWSINTNNLFIAPFSSFLTIVMYAAAVFMSFIAVEWFKAFRVTDKKQVLKSFEHALDSNGPVQD